MEKRRKAKKRFSALTSFLLALALLAGTLGAPLRPKHSAGRVLCRPT